MEESNRNMINADFIYREVALPISQRKIPMKQLLRKEALTAFVEWKNKEDKIAY